MSTCAVVRRKQKGTIPPSSQGMAGIGPYDFNGTLKGKKAHIFPQHSSIYELRASSQVRDHHRKQTDPDETQ